LLELIMGISDYVQQLRYFRNWTLSCDYLCSCVCLCVCVCVCVHIHIPIHTYLLTYVHIVYNSMHFSSLSD
jgi:hypothetical protein